jgi:hypothetical protein
MLDAIEKIIFHFPFGILDRAVSSMKNLKFKMENEK